MQARLERVVEVRGIAKLYGEVDALRDDRSRFPARRLDYAARPVGCGKTTLLKIIAGLIEPTTGEVPGEGPTVDGPGPERAFVFQDFALMPWATVLRNVAFGLELRGVAQKRARHDIARRYITQVGLVGFEEKYPHELSGGMRQRVGLARAFAVDADVLLLDEPFSAVDEQNAAQVPGGSAALAARSSARPSSSSPTRSKRRSISPTGSCCCRAGRAASSRSSSRRSTAAPARRNPPRSGLPRYRRGDLAGPAALRGLRRGDDSVRDTACR